MAILTALFSLISRQLSNVVQAIFGWAITALFGRLPSSQQTALSAALIASIAWPLLVVGAFLPGVAAWALALIPLHKWIGDTALRLVWIGLAVVVPLCVGAIARWVTPPDKLKGGLARTLVCGYALTLGYFVAFLVTAVTVPVVRMMAIVKRWGDEHVYVQSKPHHYAQVLESLAAACKTAGCEVVVEPIPTAMQLATKAIKWFASGAMSPILDEEPQRLVGKELEVYLYPADLLLRGEATRIARVRAAMTRTKIESHAHLVREPEAQAIEDEVEAMWGVIARHEAEAAPVGALADSRFRAIVKEVDTVPISFESWTVLQTGIRTLERALQGARHLPPQESVMNDSSQEPRAARESEAGVARESRESVSTKDLLVEGLAEAKNLARIEVALAKEEALTELRALHASYVSFLVCAACAVTAISALVASILLVTNVIVGFIAGGVLVVAAVVAGYAGYSKIPVHIMQKTRRRLLNESHDIQERLA